MTPALPPFPQALRYVWDWFDEILGGVAPNGMTAKAIGWNDLAAWCALTGTALRPWEVRLLINLSVRRVAILSEEKPQNGHPQQV